MTDDTARAEIDVECLECGGRGRVVAPARPSGLLREAAQRLSDRATAQTTGSRVRSMFPLRWTVRDEDLSALRAALAATINHLAATGDSEGPHGTICKCGLAKSYHAPGRAHNLADHEYEPRYPTGDSEPKKKRDRIDWSNVVVDEGDEAP